MHALWYWIWAETIKSDPSVLYRWCRVAVFQLQLLDQQFLVVWWEVAVGVFLPVLFPGASRLRVAEERGWWLFVPRTRHVSNSCYLCWFVWNLLVPTVVAGLSLISCFVDSCWVLGGQRPAAGSGQHWVTSRCAGEPCRAVGRRDTRRKPCCLVITARPWRLCRKGPNRLTAKPYRRFLAKNKWKSCRRNKLNQDVFLSLSFLVQSCLMYLLLQMRFGLVPVSQAFIFFFVGDMV